MKLKKQPAYDWRADAEASILKFVNENGDDGKVDARRSSRVYLRSLASLIKFDLYRRILFRGKPTPLVRKLSNQLLRRPAHDINGPEKKREKERRILESILTVLAPPTTRPPDIQGGDLDSFRSLILFSACQITAARPFNTRSAFQNVHQHWCLWSQAVSRLCAVITDPFSKYINAHALTFSDLKAFNWCLFFFFT